MELQILVSVASCSQTGINTVYGLILIFSVSVVLICIDCLWLTGVSYNNEPSYEKTNNFSFLGRPDTN